MTSQPVELTVTNNKI